MQRDPHTFERTQLVCPKCNRYLNLEIPSKTLSNYDKYSTTQMTLRCSTDTCNFSKRVCTSTDSLVSEKSSCAPPAENSSGRYWKIGFGPIVILLAIYLFIYFREADRNTDVNALLKELKESYPSQRNETWYSFLSVMEKKPSVKSIIFLHNKDRTTSDCLVNKLVSLVTDNKDINIEEITFSGDKYEGVDYGLALEHYHAVVKKFGVFTANLTEVSGKIARIFHFLCDEISSDVKPSLFIFTLKCDSSTGNLKPLEKATTILKDKWSDLHSSDLFPLLSRVVKNVVEIIPETQCPCC